ncbi:hypothetical protein HYE68_008715 [Fusarium pseudograminearum]|nr:hypothetical protein HYE68_008715 [Fusarium pseudograminearum]
MMLEIGQLLTLTFLLHGTCSGFVIRDTEEVSIYYPDATFQYVLEDFEVANGMDSSLQERTNVRVCEYPSVQHLANCVAIVSSLQSMGIALGNAIKTLSKSNSCETVSGTAGNGKVKYRYYATGRHCDTTAEASTIAGAIEHHLKHVSGGKLCRTECLDLTHGGTWNGYLLIGPASKFESDMYCGPKLPFTSCDSGGKGDLH